MNWDPLACVCVLHSLTVCGLKYSKEVSYFQLDSVLVLLVGKFHIEELRNGGFKWRLLFLIDFRLFCFYLYPFLYRYIAHPLYPRHQYIKFILGEKFHVTSLLK